MRLVDGEHVGEGRHRADASHLQQQLGFDVHLAAQLLDLPVEGSDPPGQLADLLDQWQQSLLHLLRHGRQDLVRKRAGVALGQPFAERLHRSPAVVDQRRPALDQSVPRAE